MDKLNENAGLVAVIVGAILLAVLILVVLMLVVLRKKIAVQRLKFVGRYTADPNTRKMVANITISNRSLSDVTISELGLKNGKVNLNYTDVYKAQYKLGKDARIVVGQRDAIRFTLPAEELVKTLILNQKGKIVLKKISVYVMDSTGIPYVGKVGDVKKLLSELAKNGVDYLPPAFEPNSTSSSAAPATNSGAPKAEPKPMPVPTPNPIPVPTTPAAPAPAMPAAPMPAMPAAPAPEGVEPELAASAVPPQEVEPQG